MGTDYKLGSMVTFQCEAGYMLQGYSTLTCIMGNSKRPEWDRAKPSCQGERGAFKMIVSGGTFGLCLSVDPAGEGLR